ncbi:hypothetical protein [Baekduia alba]|uniref:hypothetical protein n=1 Tax=Baekduia alba TaxID=2997333 RepID=UPI00234138F3|nr:hypothetical protein [Baekduia alba]
MQTAERIRRGGEAARPRHAAAPASRRDHGAGARVAALQRRAGNHATARAMLARTRIDLDDGTPVPGTAEERLEPLLAYLDAPTTTRRDLAKLQHRLLGLPHQTQFDGLALAAVRLRLKATGTRPAEATGAQQQEPKRAREDEEVQVGVAADVDPQLASMAALTAMEHLIITLPLADVLAVAGVTVRLHNEVSRAIQRRFVPIEPAQPRVGAPGTIESLVAPRVLHLLLRYAGGHAPVLADFPRRAHVLDDLALPLVPDIVRALGWRRYTSALRVSPNMLVLTLTDLAEEVELHATTSALIRGGATHPGGPYRTRPDLSDDRLRGQHGDVVRYWLELYAAAQRRGQPRNLRIEDTQAIRFASAMGATGAGHHTSVVSSEGQPTFHSNRHLSDQQLTRIGPGHRPVLATEDSRRGWGPERGVGRHGRWDLPYHSESQSVETIQPWRIRYVGNLYRACVSCLAFYRSIGIPSVQQDPAHGGFDTSHGAKVPAIVPPLVRGTSVYLDEYLGYGAQVMVALRAAVVELLQCRASLGNARANVDAARQAGQTEDQLRPLVSRVGALERRLARLVLLPPQRVAELMLVLDALERGEGDAFYTEHRLEPPGDRLG